MPARQRNWRVVFLLVLAGCCALPIQLRAQQQPEPEDPEDEKRLGLWLDQVVSAGLSTSKNLVFEFHQRFDNNDRTLYEYFFQGGLSFRLRPWLTITPIYRYQRFPINPRINYENRLLLNFTASRAQGDWQPNLRTIIEERIPDNLSASARLRFRPGLDYTLPLRVKRRPVLVVNNEFFVVPGHNPFANGGSSFTQSRFQVGGPAAARRHILDPPVLLASIGGTTEGLGYERDPRDIACLSSSPEDEVTNQSVGTLIRAYDGSRGFFQRNPGKREKSRSVV